MPTLLRIGAYRFHFYVGDHRPPHVHVASGSAEAVFLLESGLRVRRYGYTPREMNEIERLVALHHERLLRAWHEHFDE